MNPLCAMGALKIYRGRMNLDSFIQSGFCHILKTPNPLVTQNLRDLLLSISETHSNHLYMVKPTFHHVAVQNL